MDKKGLLYKMDLPSLNGTAETNGKHNLDNYISEFNRARSTHTGTNGLSTKINNLQHVFQEQYLPKKSFKESKKFYSTHSIDDDTFAKRLNKITKTNDDESDGNDTDHINSFTTRSQSGTLMKSKYSFDDDTPLSKKSFHSYKIDDMKNDSTFINSNKIYTSSFVNNNSTAGIYDTTPPSIKASTNYLSTVVREGEMNFIMLIGLVAGLIVSKLLNFMQLYLNWLLDKIVQARNVALGTNSIWQFINLNDTNNFQMQYKLVLIPLGFISMLMYGFVYVLYCSIWLLLTSAPSGMIKFVQNLHK